MSLLTFTNQIWNAKTNVRAVSDSLLRAGPELLDLPLNETDRAIFATALEAATDCEEALMELRKALAGSGQP